MKLNPQHRFDRCLGGGGGMEVWECSRCKCSAFPAPLGGFWQSLARYVPFAGRWRCVPVVRPGVSRPGIPRGRRPAKCPGACSCSDVCGQAVIDAR